MPSQAFHAFAGWAMTRGMHKLWAGNTHEVQNPIPVNALLAPLICQKDNWPTKYSIGTPKRILNRGQRLRGFKTTMLALHKPMCRGKASMGLIG